MPRYKAIPPWLWIYYYLKKKGADFINSMFKQYRKYVISRGYKGIRRGSFYRYIRELRRRGLIEIDHIEEIPNKKLRPRVYYRLSRKGRKESVWLTLSRVWGKII